MSSQRLCVCVLTAVLIVASAFTAVARAVDQDSRRTTLAKEVRDKGWIIFSAKTSKGDWDLFVMRPDGSRIRNITNTSEWSEAAPRFSPDAKNILYRRLEKGRTISHDRWGFQGQLMIADSDGSHPVEFGKPGEFTWAAWSGDGQELSCLSLRGIEIVDRVTKQVVRKLPREGVFQQLFGSPDGKWFCGTANVGGEKWTIVRIDATSGKMNVVSKYQNCTPDWFPDSKRMIFSNRPAGQGGYGWTQLWMADAAGTNRELIYGEDGRHIYGGALSPDGKYVLFTRCPQDGGGSERGGAPGGLMRLSDAPTIAGESKTLRRMHPDAKDGPVLTLPDCWEPHWTFADIGVVN
jgi:Tol biopolymer transport system component